MTIRQLVDFLLDFDPDMEVAILSDGEDFLPICEMATDVVELEDMETKEKEEILVLVPCYGEHPEDDESVENIVNPILN